MKFRKKPVVIEAIRAREAADYARLHWAWLPVWLSEAYEDGGVVFEHDSVTIKTLEGVMTSGPDDWIICGVKGELYPCKPDIFQATYEKVEE